MEVHALAFVTCVDRPALAKTHETPSRLAWRNDTCWTLAAHGEAYFWGCFQRALRLLTTNRHTVYPLPPTYPLTPLPRRITKSRARSLPHGSTTHSRSSACTHHLQVLDNTKLGKHHFDFQIIIGEGGFGKVRHATPRHATPSRSTRKARPPQATPHHTKRTNTVPTD